MTSNLDKRGVVWTDEEDALLTKYWGEGWSAGDLARFKFQDRTRNSIIGRISRLGIKRGNIGNRSSIEISARIRAKRKPAPKIKVKLMNSTVAPSLNMPLENLGFHSCRWPTSEDRPHLFCGNPKLPGSPYCEGHTVAASAGRHLHPVRAPYEHNRNRGFIFADFERMAA